MRHPFYRILLFWFCLCIVLIFTNWNNRSISHPLLAAAPSRVPATDLPPPTSTPLPKRTPVATLILNVSSTTQQLFSVVQWQNSKGDWIDVEGWRGAVSGGKTIWWVEEKEWGQGPFRWVVYRVEGKEKRIVLGISEYFSLPAKQGEIKQIPVQI